MISLHALYTSRLPIPLYFSHYYNRRCWRMVFELTGVIKTSTSVENFGHNRSRSILSKRKLVTCWHLLGLLNYMKNILYIPLTQLIRTLKTWIWASYILNSTSSLASSSVTTLTFVFSATHYLAFINVVSIYYKSLLFFLPAKIKLVVWTL
jgi:hypothetical protein